MAAKLTWMNLLTYYMMNLMEVSCLETLPKMNMFFLCRLSTTQNVYTLELVKKNHRFYLCLSGPDSYASSNINSLLEFYMDPIRHHSRCTTINTFCIPHLLLMPVMRKNPFSLKELSRSIICEHTTYNGINALSIPSTLKPFMTVYHYKHEPESKDRTLLVREK